MAVASGTSGPKGSKWPQECLMWVRY